MSLRSWKTNTQPFTITSAWRPNLKNSSKRLTRFQLRLKNRLPIFRVDSRTLSISRKKNLGKRISSLSQKLWRRLRHPNSWLNTSQTLTSAYGTSGLSFRSSKTKARDAARYSWGMTKSLLTRHLGSPWFYSKPRWTLSVLKSTQSLRKSKKPYRIFTEAT